MTFKISKDPMKMSLEELFQTQQTLQQEGKKQGQHYPMYTKRKPTNGEQPSVDNMHEEATRDQLNHMYKQQNGTEKTKEPASDDRVAQGTTQKGVDALGTVRDGVGLWSEFEQLKQKRNKSWMQEYKNQGLLPSDFKKKLKNGNPSGFTGDLNELAKQYELFYYGK